MSKIVVTPKEADPKKPSISAVEDAAANEIPEGADEDTSASDIDENVSKTFGNTDVSGAKKNVSDLVVFGNGDTFQLICKASSKAEGWMKSTKAMEIPEMGCVVQVTTQQGDQVAEALVFVPGASIKTDADGNRKLARR